MSAGRTAVMVAPLPRHLLDEAAGRLRAAGIASARLDAEILFEQATGRSAEERLRNPGKGVATQDESRFRGMVGRRAAREPISHIVGYREFWSLAIEVTPDTLTPRPDSETVVAAALDALEGAGIGDGAALSILDLGAGGGCLLLALLTELPAATGLGVDVSAPALEIAARNARALGLAGRARFAGADWNQPEDNRFGPIRELAPFDLVICNPPYVSDGELDGLEPEVRCHEPRTSLSGGRDGLNAYHAIGPILPALLGDGGIAAFEVGAGQARDVARILNASGLEILGFHRDLSGIDRCITAKNG